MKRRFMTRESLDELAANMPIISFEEQPQFVGGFWREDDCFWSCVSYRLTGSENNSEMYCMQYLHDLYSDYYNEMNHLSSYGAGLQVNEAYYYCLGNGNLNNIFYLDINNIPGLNVQGIGGGWHSVCFEGPTAEGMHFYDPQNHQDYYIDNADLVGHYYKIC